MGRTQVPQFGKAYTPEIEMPFLELGEFAQHVEAVTGLKLGDIKADGLRITGEPGRMDAPVYLEVTTYCRNEQGRVYFDENRDVATEVRRFPIGSLVLNASL